MDSNHWQKNVKNNLIINLLNYSELLDFSTLSLHEAKKEEMESQVRTLELEAELTKERFFQYFNYSKNLILKTSFGRSEEATFSFGSIGLHQ